MNIPVQLELTFRYGKQIVEVGGKTYLALSWYDGGGTPACLLLEFEPKHAKMGDFYVWLTNTERMVKVTAKKSSSAAARELIGPMTDLTGHFGVLDLQQVTLMIAHKIIERETPDELWRGVVADQLEVCWSAGVLNSFQLAEEIPQLCKELNVDYDKWVAIGMLTGTRAWEPVTINSEQHADPTFWDNHIAPIDGKAKYMPVCVHLIMAALPQLVSDIREELAEEA